MISITLTDADAIAYNTLKATVKQNAAYKQDSEKYTEVVAQLTEKIEAKEYIIHQQRRLITELKTQLNNIPGAVEPVVDLHKTQRAKQDEIEGPAGHPFGEQPKSAPKPAPIILDGVSEPVPKKKDKTPVTKVNGRDKIYKFTLANYEVIEERLGMHFPSAGLQVNVLYGKFPTGFMSFENFKLRLKPLGIKLVDNDKWANMHQWDDKSKFDRIVAKLKKKGK